MINPFKNISLNMRAKGPATVICVWILCVTVLGLFGKGEYADKAISLLAFAGGAVLTALAMRIYPE